MKQLRIQKVVASVGLSIKPDWSGGYMRTSRVPSELSAVSEGFCPWCLEKLIVTDEPPDSPRYAEAVEASIGEEWASALLHCRCCQGLFDIPRGELTEYEALFDNIERTRSTLLPMACQHAKQYLIQGVRVRPA